MEQSQLLLDLGGSAAMYGSLVVLLTAAVKRLIPALSGWMILIPNIVFSVAIALYQYYAQPYYIPVFAVLVFGFAIGAWESAKKLAHKVGTPDSTVKQPGE